MTPSRSCGFFLLFFALTSCSAMTVVQVTDYDRPMNFRQVKVSPKEVRVMQEQFPEGFGQKNGTIVVETSFRGKYVLLGSIQVELQPSPALPVMWTENAKAKEDWNGFNKFCAYDFLGYLPLPYVLNYVNPFAIPCYFQDTKTGEGPEDLEYRKNLLLKKLKKVAAEKGANLVVGVRTGGISVFDRNGDHLANKSIYSAVGYMVYEERPGQGKSGVSF